VVRGIHSSDFQRVYSTTRGAYSPRREDCRRGKKKKEWEKKNCVGPRGRFKKNGVGGKQNEMVPKKLKRWAPKGERGLYKQRNGNAKKTS